MSKLVRDKIPELLKEKDISPKTRILHKDKEFLEALNKKLIEEVDEFIEVSTGTDDEHIKEELSDVLEVIDAILKLKKYDLKEIQDIKKNKRLKRGGFDKRILSIY